MATAAQRKKAAAAKAAKAKADKANKAKEDTAGKRAAQREADKDLIAEIKEMRADDKTHAEIAKKLNIQATKALFLDIVGQVKKADRLRKDDVDGDLVKTLRDEEGLAWHTISARVYASGDSLGIPAIKKLYAEAGGKGTSGRSKSAKSKSTGKRSGSRRKRGGRGNS